MKTKKFLSKIIMILCICTLVSVNMSVVNAGCVEDRAVDTVNKTTSHTFSYTKNPVSVDIGNVSDIPSQYRNVSFSVALKGAMQYDRITGKYVSASTPTAVLQYVGGVPLQMTNVSTSKRDNGNSITFSYSADIIANVDIGIYVRISYGRISGSYTVNK